LGITNKGLPILQRFFGGGKWQKDAKFGVEKKKKKKLKSPELDHSF